MRVILLVAVAAVVLIITGVGVYLYYKKKKEEETSGTSGTTAGTATGGSSSTGSSTSSSSSTGGTTSTSSSYTPADTTPTGTPSSILNNSNSSPAASRLTGEGFGSGTTSGTPKSLRLFVVGVHGVTYAGSLFLGGFNGLFVVTPQITEDTRAAMALFRQGAKVRIHSVTSRGIAVPFEIVTTLALSTTWTLVNGYQQNVLKFNDRFEIEKNGLSGLPAFPIEMTVDVYP